MTIKRSQLSNHSIDSQTLYRYLPISLILIVATALFTYRLGQEGLWIDELFSIRDASQSLSGIYRANQLRPLYYLLLAGWMQFGSSDAWLRSLSVIFAVISVFLIYQLGKRIDGNVTGLVSAGLLTASPLFINHAQEVRMYVLSLGLGLMGTLCLANAALTNHTGQTSQKNIAGWTIFRLLAIYTVPLNVTLLLPDAVIVFLRFRQSPHIILNFGKWLLLLLLLWSPSVLSVIQAAAPNTDYAVDRAQYLAPPGLNNLIYPLKYWMVPPQIVRVSAAAHIFYKLFTLLVVGLIGAGLIRKHKSPALLLTIAWFVLPLVPIVVFSRISAQLWEPRYVLFVSPYLLILVASGFTRLWREWRIAAIAAAAIYTSAMIWALLHYYSVQNRSDYRFNIETIEQFDQPGDAVVWGYEWDEPLRYYYDNAVDTYWLDMHDIETPEAIQPWLNKLPKGYKRLWVVLDDTRPVMDEFEAAIARTYTVKKSISYERDSTVLLLVPNKTPSIPPQTPL